MTGWPAARGAAVAGHVQMDVAVAEMAEAGHAQVHLAGQGVQVAQEVRDAGHGHGHVLLAPVGGRP